MPKLQRRDWTDARKKVDKEGRCRVGGRHPGHGGDLEAAHTIGREHDTPKVAQDGDELSVVEELWVNPVDVVPLCRQCHALYDHRRLDLLPYLTPEEQAMAVLRSGGIVSAYRRLTGGDAIV